MSDKQWFYKKFDPTKSPTYFLLIPYQSPTNMRIKYEGPTFSQKGPSFEKYSMTFEKYSMTFEKYSMTFEKYSMTIF